MPIVNKKRAPQYEECLLARSALRGKWKMRIRALTAEQDESECQQTGTQQHRAHWFRHHEAVGCIYQSCTGVGRVDLDVIGDVERGKWRARKCNRRLARYAASAQSHQRNRIGALVIRYRAGPVDVAGGRPVETIANSLEVSRKCTRHCVGQN